MDNQYQDPSQNLQDASEDSDNENENQDSTRQVGKRRSKNDNQGRDFKCKYCEKTYLSYPALYTHMKQKHDPSSRKEESKQVPADVKESLISIDF